MTDVALALALALSMLAVGGCASSPAPIEVRVDGPGVVATSTPPPDATTSSAPVTPSPEKTPAPNDSAALAEIVASIHEQSALEHDITDRGLEARFAHVTLLAPNVRAVARDAPRRPAITIVGVERGSVLDRLGFRSGDVLLEVAGRDIASPDRALEAYVALRQLVVIPVVVERKGRRVFMIVRVVPT